MMFPRPISVLSQGKYKIWLKYTDQTEGTIDLTHLANQGVFKSWEIESFFNLVHIDAVSNAVAWNEDIDLCPNSLYLQLKNISFENWLNQENYHATN